MTAQTAAPGAPIQLPMAVEDVPSLQAQVRELARERNAVILA
ncbi:MAG: hypothetical protein QOC95_1491, partial [Thermoleophilaceae bacterium]|nr:hypothetical protein [Thermoleophilaceae bacterium]